MTHKLLTSGFAACIVFATSYTLRADPTNAPAQNPQQPHRLLAPTGLNANQPAISGFALGGPIGILTDQQRASYETAMRAMRGRFLELDSKLRAVHQDLLNTSVTAKFDENVIRQKALVAARIEAELTVLRIKAFSEVQPPLSPEQVDKIKAGQPGAMHQLEHPGIERQLRRESPAGSTNQDQNGLPPKQ